MDSAQHVPTHVPRELVFDFDIYGDHRIGVDVQRSTAAALSGAPDIFYTPQNGGHWVVRRYDQMVKVVREPETFSVREMQIPRVSNPPFFIPLSLDPPENVPYRRALAAKFSPKAVQELEPAIRTRATEIVRQIANRGGCDFVKDVSAPFPVSVFMDLMGLPADRLAEFREIADQYFRARTPEEFQAVSQAIFAIFEELIRLRRETPGTDMISHLVTVTLDDLALSQDELLAMCFVLFLGGMDTVTNSLSFAFRQLAHNAPLQRQLLSNPDGIPGFVEESLRCFGVVNTSRLVVQDSDAYGVPFRKGDMVVCMLSISGRDDRQNSLPDAFDIGRERQIHLTFSSGPHVCVGQLLARTEMKILTEVWLSTIGPFSTAACADYGLRIGLVDAIATLPLIWCDKRGTVAA